MKHTQQNELMMMITTQISALGKGICLMILLLGVVACGESNNNSEGNEVTKAPSISIHEATFFGDLKTVQQHIKAKSDLNEKDEYGSAPLTIATLFGKTEVALALIDAGADINTTGGDGSTPLHTAAFFCRTEIVKKLLAKGATVDHKNSFGMTPLESIQMSFKDAKGIYDQMLKDLAPLGLRLDYEYLETTRPIIAELISTH